MIEVRPIERKGCLWVAGTVFSLGLLPLLAGREARITPARLTEEGMTLRNGLHVPWSTVTRVAATEVYLKRRYIRTRYVITHTRGKAAIESNGVQDAERVIQYILSHVPPAALGR